MNPISQSTADPSLDEARSARSAGSLNRAELIVRSVASGGRSGASLVELAEMTGLPRPTIHRVCHILQDIGWLERDGDSRRFYLGAELALLALTAQMRHPLETRAYPILDHLSRELAQTFYLSIRSGKDTVCVARCESGAHVTMLIVEVGTRLPLGIGSAGMSILAGLAQEEADLIIAANLHRYAARIPFDEAAFRKELALTRDRRFARHDGLFAPGMSGIGVPVLDKSGYPLASISTAFITASLDEDRQQRCVALMEAGAGDLARLMVPSNQFPQDQIAQ